MSTNYIDQITDTAGTTQDISESDSTRIFRATCSTAASTAAKVATLQTSNKNFSLATGVRVAVTFTYGNSATTPTLRVDGSSTGTAKDIIVWADNNSIMTGGGTTYFYWGPYETIIFTYNGSYWVIGQGGAIYKAYSLANSKTSNTGTVTKVTAGTGLSIGTTAGGDLTTSGTINHTNSVTAQTTQAIYPIKIDAQGHISAYGSAVTIPTDTKVTQTEISTSSRPNDSLRLLFSNSGISGTVTSGVSYINWLYYNPSLNELTLSGSGTISATNLYGTELGGDTIHLSSGSPNWYDNTLTATGTTANRSYNFPNKSGTVALTSDIPNVSGKIDTAGTGLSKSGTTLNHSNSVTAQTTQAVYPIKIDAQGHISGYGSAVTSMPASDVSSWAKATSKPTYTASEVGAVPTSRTVNGKALSANITLSASDVSALPSSTSILPTVPTLSATGLTSYSSRCSITSGGVYTFGKWVFVQLQLKNLTSLSANNTWGYMDGFPVPRTSLAAISVYAVQNYGNISGQINSDGRLILATGGSALAVNTVISVSGWYIAS